MSGDSLTNSTSKTEAKDDGKNSKTSKRKFHQKSRLGCSTCKKRRVKCDETRPSCKKCQHLNLTCGYLVDGAGAPEDDEAPKKKRKASSSSTSSSRTERSVSPPLPSVETPKMEQEPVPPLTPGILSQLNLATFGSPAPAANSPAPATNIPSASSSTSAAAAAAAAVKGSPWSGLLNAGNLNNLNLSHLVNNLSGLGDLSSLGNLASLSNLATLAQLPIDLSNLGTLIDSQIHSNINKQESTAASNPSAVSGSASTPTPNLVNNGTYGTPGNTPGTSAPLQQPQPQQAANAGAESLPNISANISNPSPNLSNLPLNHPMAGMGPGASGLNMLDLRLMFHYTSQVSNTITGAGISDTNIWNHDIPMLAFNYPFLMHSILAFSATHLSRTEKGLDQCVTCHRGDALRLLREAVLDINSDNTDALVASALILIMDSLANASFPSSTSPKSLPASAWIFHVKGAATILTAVWPLTETSRFYKFISVDLGDLGDITNHSSQLHRDDKLKFSDKSSDIQYFTDLECHDSDIADLFPVEMESPYLITLAYLNKLHKERYKSDFILRIFAFPALLDKSFLSLLMTGDIKAMRIMRSYYKLLRSFTTEMKDKVWFLEGVSQVLPVDVEEYAGGAGGMHMMLDFLGGGPSIVDDHEIDEEIGKFDPSGALTNKLIDTNNLPSDITSNLDVMQGDNGFMNIK